MSIRRRDCGGMAVQNRPRGTTRPADRGQVGATRGQNGLQTRSPWAHLSRHALSLAGSGRKQAGSLGGRKLLRPRGRYLLSQRPHCYRSSFAIGRWTVAANGVTCIDVQALATIFNLSGTARIPQLINK